jgi:hypothetical protein
LRVVLDWGVWSKVAVNERDVASSGPEQRVEASGLDTGNPELSACLQGIAMSINARVGTIGATIPPADIEFAVRPVSPGAQHQI